MNQADLAAAASDLTAVEDEVLGKPARRGRRADPMLLEIAWEACNQVGGIYTVLRSKVPSMVSRWGNRYCLVGPY
ncbi:MAG: glycogen synthase, partial [Planctomycetota bacterium]